MDKSNGEKRMLTIVRVPETLKRLIGEYRGIFCFASLYMTNCQHIRVTAQGKRMKITNVTSWNIIDHNHFHCGQGDTCIEWYFL